MNILFIASEAMPAIKTGGLADVIGALPKELKREEVDARVMIPLYKSIREKYKDKLEFVTSFGVALAWRTVHCGIFQAEFEGVKYYFLDNEHYFDRDGIYGFFDDGERFAYFSKAALDACKHLGDYKPEVLHCHDWQAALVPVFLKSHYAEDAFFRGIRSVFTIHNIEYQGMYDRKIGGDILGFEPWQMGLIEYKKDVNYMKAAVIACDKLTTVSPSYAEEIKMPFFSHGLDPIIRENEYKLCGIINGIDNEIYDPNKDPLIFKNFTNRSPKRKKENKVELQKQFGLIEDPNIPLIGMIGRLVSHKGVDLVRDIFDELMQENVQVVILGSGEYSYQDFFHNKVSQYHGRVGTYIGFSPDLANKIYASSDFFLMPSKSEPCGLAQMIALRYGTVPIVRETGGLKDSIEAYNKYEGTGNGFSFANYNANEMLLIIKEALEIYGDESQWKVLLKNAFGSDFSWKKSAQKYIEMYREILS